MAHALAGSAAYTCFERVEGTADGRTGAFILAHNAVMADGVGRSDIVVMAASGTAGFAGLTGTASIDRRDDGSHTLLLDYELASAT